ncbi:PLP-dependent aminotransferase family protein [Pseudomonas stutzeri]|nr:PLP-dependent aminotransferase family protein [Stutzerimonas stutzeri]
MSRLKNTFFCNSTYHNPTGGNLSPRNAFSVLRLAVEHGFLIIEDDVYGDFSPANRQTFAELDSLDQVIYIGSFSKLLSASLRVGYIACAAELIEPLTRLKLLTSVAVPGFCERFVNTVLVDGTYLRHMKSVQQQLMTHQKRAQKALTQQGWRFDIVPDGGMFLWVRHPDMADLTSFIARLAKRDVLLMPGSAFAVERDQSDHTRINVAHFSPDMARLFTEGREEA